MAAYLLGMHRWWNYHEADTTKAIGYFPETIKTDPSYAPAHAGLAWTYCSGGRADSGRS